jgi:hypothetical protein
MEIMPDAVGTESEAEEKLLGAREGRAIPVYGAKALAVRAELLSVLESGRGVHVSVPELAAYAPEYRAFFTHHLASELDALYPFGWESAINLWVSGAAHVYEAHVDLLDGLLVQLNGEKQVRVWPVAKEFDENLLVQFAFQERPDLFRSGEPQTFTLTPGDCLFIPAGRLHEVRLPGDTQSVSITFFAGAPYPLLEVCQALNLLSNAVDGFTLPSAMSYVDKFRCTFLNPRVYCKPHGSALAMPAAVREPLLRTIQSSTSALEQELPALLERWWVSSHRQRSYPGTIPHAMKTTLDQNRALPSLTADLSIPSEPDKS